MSIPNAECRMPNAEYRMPDAEYRMPDAEWRMLNAEWRRMTGAAMSNASAERNRLSGFYPDIFPGAGPGESEQADEHRDHGRLAHVADQNPCQRNDSATDDGQAPEEVCER